MYEKKEKCFGKNQLKISYLKKKTNRTRKITIAVFFYFLNKSFCD